MINFKNLKEQLKQLNIELIEIIYDLSPENGGRITSSYSNSKEKLNANIKNIEKTYKKYNCYIKTSIYKPNLYYVNNKNKVNNNIIITSSYLKGCLRCLFYNHFIIDNNSSHYYNIYKNLFGSDFDSKQNELFETESHSGSLIFFDAILNDKNSIVINIGVKLDNIIFDNFKDIPILNNKTTSIKNINDLKDLICHLLKQEYLISDKKLDTLTLKEKNKRKNKLMKVAQN